MKATIIFGLGAEGLSTYRYLRSLTTKPNFLLIDDKPLAALAKQWQKIINTDRQVQFLSSKSVTEADLRDRLLVKTPGIAPSHHVCQLAKKLKLVQTSNTQLFFAYLSRHAPDTLTIGVTGTKGKSTTTALIHHVLQSTKLPVLLAGNIGEPALNLVPPIKKLRQSQQKPIVVLELSSHQLLNLPYSPKIAVLLHITPEHLDYYASYNQYIEAKSSICRFQQEEDLIVFNPSHQDSKNMAALSPAKQLLFADMDSNSNSQDKALFSATLEKNLILSEGEVVLPTSQLPLIGRHQWTNVLPSVIIGKHLGLTNKQISQALRSFQPLAHRLELVANHNNIKYYNDSQATTPEAAIAALRSFPKESVVLIAGGSEKGVDLRSFAQEILKRQVVALALFPPTGAKIAKLLKEEAKTDNYDLPTWKIVQSMSEAVTFVRAKAKPGMTILLSPACASFGIFRNYRDRGEQFRAAVQTQINT